MKIYTIDADGNALIKVQVDGDKMEVLDAMNGWGYNIKDKTKVKEDERNEEIKCASKDYVNYLLDKQEYHNEKYTEHDIKQAFEKGAEWADEYPVDVWHDASVEPQDGYLLIEFGENKYDALLLPHYFGESIWKIWCREGKIIRWAYIKDLMPKGGEK